MISNEIAHEELDGLKMSGAGFIDHEWKRYSADEDAVWAELCRRRLPELPGTASAAYLKGLDALDMPFDRVPYFDELNAKLLPLTDWSIRAVNGFIPAKMFFGSMAERRFPSTLEIRPAEQLEYLQEPDIFHDIFGHIPMHTDAVFADFVQQYGKLAADLQDQERFDALARLFWYTVEFGLISEQDQVRLYGSGLISSFGEAAHVYRGGPEIRPFDLNEIITTPFRIDIYQPVLFVIDGFDQLVESVQTLRGRWEDSLAPAARAS